MSPAVGLDGYLYAEGVCEARVNWFVWRTRSGRAREIPDEKHLSNFEPFVRMEKVAEQFPARSGARAGSFIMNFKRPREAWTGTWRFGLFLPGSDQEIASVKSGVEAFVPLDWRSRANRFGPGSGWLIRPRSKIASRYLFGVAASGMPFQVSGEWRQVPFEAIGLEDFTFW